MSEYEPMSVCAVRAYYTLTGKGSWAGSSATYGYTVTAYRREDWPTADNGLVPMGASWCVPVSTTETLSNIGFTCSRGFLPADSWPVWGAQHQDYVAKQLAYFPDNFYTWFSSAFQVTSITLRPFGKLAPPGGPGLLTTLPSTVYRPISGTRWPSVGSSQPILVAAKMRTPSLRRGHRWTGRVHLGPVSLTMLDSATGLVPASSQTSLAAAQATILNRLRSGSFGATLPVRTMPVVWPRGWETGSPIQTVDVQDELGAMSSRQRHRRGVWVRSAQLT